MMVSTYRPRMGVVDASAFHQVISSGLGRAVFSLVVEPERRAF